MSSLIFCIRQKITILPSTASPKMHISEATGMCITDPETGKQSSRTDQQAWQAGFVSPYAMSEAREDFVENIAIYVTHDEYYWKSMLAAAGESGEAIINKKFNIVYNYMRDTWGIDLDDLRSVVLRRQDEIYSLDLNTIDIEDDINSTNN